MSTPAPRITQRVIDNTQSVPNLLDGVVFVQGITERGPVHDPSKIINSWSAFRNLFGGFIEGSDFPLHCKILLDRGCKLRVNSIKNNPTHASVILANDEGSPQNLFTLRAKYPGVAYNFDDTGDDDKGLLVKAVAPSDSELGGFNLQVYFDGDLVETFENLTTSETGLNTALANSKWIELLTMADLTSVTNLVPEFEDYELDNGADGDLVTDTEMADFSAFDPFDDSYCLVAPEEQGSVVHLAGVTYAELRKDIRYYASLATDDDEDVIITGRQSLPYSKFVSYTSGGWVINDPVTGVKKNISEVSNFVANFIKVADESAIWFSFSGPDNPVPGVVGPVYNFGSKAKFNELDLLNRNHINMAINRNGVNMFWGNFTAQRENTHLKFISTHNLILYISKVLGPTLETFIEKPLDIPLFRQIHQVVQPFLDSLVSGRAVFSYAWNGDQNAVNLDSLQVNDPVDIQMGIYKVDLPIVRINPLQEIQLTIELTRAGVTIE